ncbi:MAG: four helix bundle protein [bacterium]|nr:four helix bundle protein [bacterium]
MEPTKIFKDTYNFYAHLYQDLGKIPKRERFTWGQRCETIALEALAISAKADYLARNEKRIAVRALSFQIDLLQIFLRLGSDLKILDYKKYLARSAELISIGKMIGGWIKTLP